MNFYASRRWKEITHPLAMENYVPSKTEAFTGYRVQIEDNDYFELDGFMIRRYESSI